MPYLVNPSLPAGTLRALEQPGLGVDDRLALRPWHESDATAVKAAFGCPDIQRWHVRRMDTDGQVGLRTISLFDGSAQLSYWVAPEARGSGVATRAALALTRWTFDVVGLHRVFLQHSTANLASCRVAAKLGFGVEGTLRSAVLHADGWHDMHGHALLRTDEQCRQKRSPRFGRSTTMGHHRPRDER